MIKAIIPATLLLACTVSARGACIQVDIAGKWTAYSILQDNTGKLAWTACTLAVNAQGKFTTATSFCKGLGRTLPVHGVLTIEAPTKCLFDGSMTNSQGVTAPIQVTLSLDKQTAAGVGGRSGHDNVFTLSMVRIQ